ncbi:squalene/phytoene synthase family protein [Haladaptatus pallidirubidus]|uniref:squalene/phytoene synthase family protein n=1 Tax=Haladaptatus pallidirubidus TaxID=1008152 RepID=UPI0035E88265
MRDTHVQAGKSIQQQTGKTFHLATRLLPKQVRHPTYVLYGFFRVCDDVADEEIENFEFPEVSQPPCATNSVGRNRCTVTASQESSTSQNIAS